MNAAVMFKDTRDKGAGLQNDALQYWRAIQETCVGELCHWLLIFFSGVLLVIINSNWKWPLWGGYLLFNLADIVIQRFNRPRLMRIYNKLSERKK